jgi:hypothetical protein
VAGDDRAFECNRLTWKGFFGSNENIRSVMISGSGSTVGSDCAGAGSQRLTRDTVDGQLVYERIYFPAERVHFEQDSSHDAADLV